MLMIPNRRGAPRIKPICFARFKQEHEAYARWTLPRWNGKIPLQLDVQLLKNLYDCQLENIIWAGKNLHRIIFSMQREYPPANYIAAQARTAWHSLDVRATQNPSTAYLVEGFFLVDIKTVYVIYVAVPRSIFRKYKINNLAHA